MTLYQGVLATKGHPIQYSLKTGVATPGATRACSTVTFNQKTCQTLYHIYYNGIAKQQHSLCLGVTISLLEVGFVVRWSEMMRCEKHQVVL